MRFFIAIEIPEDAKERLAAVKESMDYRLAKVTWVKKENMHLTLKFLGNLRPAEIDKVKEGLRKIKFHRFDVSFDSIGVFPSEEYIRIIWVGLKPEEYIENLKLQIDEMLEKLFKKEKDFRAHITLGRVKYLEDKERVLNRLKEIKVDGDRFIVDSFKLMKSALTRQGPIYGLVEEFKCNPM